MNQLPAIDLLRIVLPQDAAANEVRWYAFDARHTLIDSGSDAVDALPAYKALQCILPASALAGHVIPISPNAGRHLAAAVDQALEDTLLGPRDDAHIVIARQTPAGRLVWVCSKKWLTTWLSRCPPTSSAFSVYELLPADGQAAMGKTAEGFIFRTAAGHVGYLDDAALVSELLGTAVDLTENLFSRSLEKDAANLLTGPFTPRGQLRFTASQFQRSGWLAGALVITLLLGTLGHWQQLEGREKSLKDEIRQTFAAAFPGTPIIDPVMQWESKQREKNGSGVKPDALDHLARFALTQAGIQPRSAEFRDGAIRLVLTETDSAKVRPRLQQDGQEFNTSPAEPGFVRLDVRVKTR